MVDLVVRDVRYAARALRMRPGFTITVAATLALGIGANATMFGILDRLLFRAPEHIVQPERLVQIHTGRLGSPYAQESQSYALYKQLLAQVPDFQSVAVSTADAEGLDYYPLGSGPTAQRVSGALVTPGLFTTLGVRPQLGRFFKDDEAGEANPQKLAVIGHGFWQRHFGGRRAAIGARLDIGTERYVVVGVAPPGFSGTGLIEADVWLPIAAADALRFAKGPDWRTTHGATWLSIYARLAPRADTRRALPQATLAYRAYERDRIAEMPRARRSNPDSATVVFGSVIPGRSPSRYGLSAGSGVVRVSRLLGVISLLVLLLACANVANLLLLRGLGRRREIAVRLALGVSRRRLAAQLLTEGFLLAALGAVGALGIVYPGSGFVRRMLLGSAAWSGSAVDARVLGVTAAAAIVAALVTSLLPVLQSSNPRLTDALKSGSREGGASRSVARSVLLATQTALALVLLAGAALFVTSLRRALHLPFGVDLNRIIVASVSHQSVGMSNAEAKELHLRFAERARWIPGVSASAVSIAHSFGMGWGTRVLWRGDTLGDWGDTGFAQYAITPDYFVVMGIRLVAGRAFTDADREGARVAVVNETAARSFWPRGDAIGQCVQVGADTVPCTTIVGIVTNSRRQQLVEGPIPQIYRPLLQLPAAVTDRTVSFFGYTLLVRADHPDRVVEPLRRAMQGAAPSAPYANVRTLRNQFGRHTRSWELGATMLSVFAGLALVLAAIGLASVVVFTLAQRRHEYGVRLALGATGRHLVWITMLRGLFPATVGLLVGGMVVLAGGKLVGALLFQTTPTDPAILGGVSAMLLAVAALACLLPGIRAARTDPAAALRAE